MRSIRGLGGVVHGSAGLVRILLAVGLLGALWVGTVKGVERSSKDADDRRASDRLALAEAFAASVGDWLRGGREEAIALSRSAVGGNAAIDAFQSTSRTFTDGALIFHGSTVSGADPDHGALLGVHPTPCTRTDERGAGVADNALDELVGAARATGTPTVSRIFDVPGSCDPAVGIAVASGAFVTVTLGDIDDLTARLAAGAHIADGRIYVITGDLALEPKQGVVTTPQRIVDFISRVTGGGPARQRYTIGGAGVLAAYNQVIPGWSVVLEQDAAVFDIELQQRPSVVVATLLTVVFAIVFFLLMLFDLRRRRAHRRAEIAKNAFFSIAGHELRTPLTVIRGFAETLSTNWRDLDDKRRRALVERIVPQALRLDRLVQRLLVGASMQAETYTRPQMSVIDAAIAVETAAARFRSQAPLHTFVVSGEPVFALADAQSLDQVLDQLLDNAVKYSPAGGTVWITLESDPRRVRILVEDEGIGLPSDHKRIFDEFVQGESVTKRVHDEGGVGLGLYIVRTLVEDMGGSVVAEPRREGGARFVVSLRAGRPERPSELTSVGAPEERLRNA